ncbi:MAG: CPBP family intramembrane glutamic endopeptidase [Ktedonobacterales bacterium]
MATPQGEQSPQSIPPIPSAPQPPYYPAPTASGAPYNANPTEPMSGYPSLPQGGFAPAHPFVAPETLDPHFGRVGRVPWTFRQTLLGTAITIVPWLAFIAATSLLSTGSSTALKPVPRPLDLVAGVIAFLFTCVAEGVFLLAPLYHAVWRRAPGTTARDGFRALGFRKTAFWPATGLVAGAIVVSFAFEILYGFITQQLNLPLQTNADRLTQQAHYAPFTIFFTLLAAIVVAPICEEVFFRGYLFGGLLRGMNVWLATIVSALLFTLVHGDIGSAVPLLIIGLILPILRWRTGSLWPGVALHTVNNLIAALAVLPFILR